MLQQGVHEPVAGSDEHAEVAGRALRLVDDHVAVGSEQRGER